MVKISSFSALRPKPDLADRLASRPYDVLNSQEARAEAAQNPYSFLHITKAEIDLSPETDSHSQVVYDKAKANLEQFIRQGFLLREEKACLYIYRLTMSGKEQTGLVCCSAIDDYEKGRIKKHELTRPDKEQDRIQHILTTGAQTGNVFLAYRNVQEIDQLIDGWKNSHAPLYNFLSADGVGHTIWKIDDPTSLAQLTKLFAE
ncbi:MAG: DUF1015 family protein, partial [Chitinophagaceae bacterium]